ncbi:uncharacterized protein EI90DRAFT_3144677 [Cantharellus anzutake]|uniref:uncharacterized protein n=1 Tax=Cantharellus anzutake TaxID=1750568 RepID=UPI00190814AB|nr:uncharacterized protein EI90DRAFT_3144677 [Cantharellus anzutake]KAF8336386.1 hypothetical protein EI90DRAFT_3144677 [Cantharellus anzutake]
MGNNLSGATTRVGGALDSYVSELGADIVYEKSLGQSRFLKTVRGRHRNGPLVIKIFIKQDPTLSLRSYQKRLKLERETLADIPNVHSVQSFLDTERAGYIFRQWLANNLYDRISTRPFLSLIEKKWVAFQLMTAMKDVRSRKIAHGDIKSENILVTSWNWVYITDFASYKPVYLPEDDPADYSFYFDTSGRRTCYVAPERFYASSEDVKQPEGTVTEAMDVFSLGCVLAELFLDGRETFTLSQLFRYRSGELNMQSHLSSIEDENIRLLISQMINIDPSERPSFAGLLERARSNSAFPPAFYTFLHSYILSVNEMASPSLDSDHRIERLWTEFDTIEPILAQQDPDALGQDVNGVALVILSLVVANIRNCSISSSKVKALDLLLALTPYLTDESKLDRLAPYVVDLVRDDAAIVRASAIRTLTQITMTVSVITAANGSFFPDYVLPNIRYMGRDPEILVRAAYAQCLVALAETSLHFLEISQAIKAHGAATSARLKSGSTGDVQEWDTAFEEDSYDTRLADLQAEIEEQVTTLLVDPSSFVKRATLHNNTAALCVFLGRQKTNDVLLSHMITYLNDRDWMLRYEFFDSIVGVAACVGRRSLEEYILPLMIQALSDVEETVVAKVLSSLTSLAELGLFQKLRIWELMSAATGFLYHPNIWIRQGAVAFITSAAKHLPVTDVWCILYPSLRPLLRSDIKSINDQSLLSRLKPNLSRTIFDAAVTWAMKSDDSLFWNPQIARKPTKFDMTSASASLTHKPKSSRSGEPKTKEDEMQIERLDQMGMPPGDETKIAILRDYILKLSQSIQRQVQHNLFLLTLSQQFRSSNSRPPLEIPGVELARQSPVGLQSLGIVPQTVFLNNRDIPPPRRTDSTRKLGALSDKRVAQLQGVRSSRAASFDSGVAYGDLRRKLAQADSSVISLSTPLSGDGRNATNMALSPRMSDVDSSGIGGSPGPIPSPHPPSSVADTDMSRDIPMFTTRPSSPSGESHASSRAPNIHSVLRTSKRGIEVGDGKKAAPAVGTVNTLATASGVIEAATKLRSDMDHDEPSGRSTPMSVTGAFRKEKRVHVPFPPPAASTYEGHEPAITNMLEHVYQDNFREGANDFGPKVASGPIRRRQPIRSSYQSRDGTGAHRKPDVTLIANLSAHNNAVNGIAVSPDHLFFVSCSDDRTVKIWDTSRLERNVTSKPRHTYTQYHARMTCVCMVEASHCFVSAADDGSIHVVRVHVSSSGSLPRYGKLQIVREHRLEQSGEFVTAMQHFNTETTSTLIYTTSYSSIVSLDLRSMRILQRMSNPIQFGMITAFCIDEGRTWLVTGTQSGTLTLWDLRFGLRMRSWKVGTSLASGDTAIHCLVVHPTSPRRTLVVVAISAKSRANSDDDDVIIIEVWDISQMTLVETFVTSEGSLTPSDEMERTSPTPLMQNPAQTDLKSPADAIAAFIRAHQKLLDAKSGDNSSIAHPDHTDPSPIPSSSSPSRHSVSSKPSDSDIRTIRSSSVSETDEDDDGDDVFMHPDGEDNTTTSKGKKRRRIARDARALIAGVNFGTPGQHSLMRHFSGEGYGGDMNLSLKIPGGEDRRGFIITGSADRRITYWDLKGGTDRSFVISGLESGAESPVFSVGRNPLDGSLTHMETRLPEPVNSQPSQRTALISSNQQHLLRGHQDCITALACLGSPFRGSLISGDRSGVIKVFRIDMD